MRGMLSLSLAVLSGFVTLSRFLSFSTVKLFSEFIHIALFLLINLHDLLLRQNLAELIIILLTDVQLSLIHI